MSPGSREQRNTPAEFRPVPKDLDQRLRQHERWVERWVKSRSDREGQLDLSDQNLEKLDLRGRMLGGAILHKANLKGANLQGAILSMSNDDGSLADNGELREANLEGANLKDVKVSPDSLMRARNWVLAFYSEDLLQQLKLPIDPPFDPFSIDSPLITPEERQASKHRLSCNHNEHLINKSLPGYDLSYLDLHEANLSGFSFIETILHHTNLSGADLQQANLEHARMHKTNLQEAKLQHAKFNLQILKRGSDYCLAFYDEDALRSLDLPSDHNTRVERKNLQGYDLHEQRLDHADLSGFNLRDADLRGASLRDAKLQKADLTGADLQGADLETAQIDEVKLQSARNWVLAKYDERMLKQLEFPLNHYDRISKKDLKGYVLKRKNLAKSDLSEAMLQGANLKNADLREANLRKAKLAEVDLREAKLRDADLQDADLEKVNGLVAEQLGATNVSGATLPQGIKEFKALEHVAETAKTAGTVFLSMLGACAYAWLTIAETRDAQLLANSGAVKLPIIDTQIPIVWFYCVMPMLLFGLYIYFHFYLQHLWEGLADLPAVFPDGRSLHQRVHPWLLNDFIYDYFAQLRPNRPPLSRVQKPFSVFLAWGTVPLTLTLFWLRYLRRHDEVLTILHIGLLTMAIWTAIILYRLAITTLRGERASFTWGHMLRNRAIQLLMPITLIVLTGFSLGAIWGIRPDFTSQARRVEEPDSVVMGLKKMVPQIFVASGFSPFAHIEDTDVSTKPAQWAGEKATEEQLDLVKGADLDGAHLQYVKARDAFMVRAKLRRANLQGADLRNADLRKANLQHANLRDVDLRNANLEGVNWEGADLSWVDFRQAKIPEPNVLRQARNWILAFYSEEVLRKLNVQRKVEGEKDAPKNVHDHNERIKKKDLSGYILRDLNLSEADLQGSNLQGADLCNTRLRAANLRGADLQKADLCQANLRRADLRKSKLQGANLTNICHAKEAQWQGAVYDYKTKWPGGSFKPDEYGAGPQRFTGRTR
jgi:uncharacterized protein YjbI with pentapeptide repeats